MNLNVSQALCLTRVSVPCVGYMSLLYDVYMCVQDKVQNPRMQNESRDKTVKDEMQGEGVWGDARSGAMCLTKKK